MKYDSMFEYLFEEHPLTTSFFTLASLLILVISVAATAAGELHEINFVSTLIIVSLIDALLIVLTTLNIKKFFKT